MFINYYLKFINFLILKQNYENYFYDSIYNSTTNLIDISCLDKFILSSAAKTCFLIDLKLVNDKYCNLIGKCRTDDNNYINNNVNYDIKDIEKINNCNGRFSLNKCFYLPIDIPSNNTIELCYNKNDCNKNNLIINFCDKHSFFQCQHDPKGGDWIIYSHSCPFKNSKEKLVFDVNLRVCNY
jgi:hypothetical protein